MVGPVSFTKKKFVEWIFVMYQMPGSKMYKANLLTLCSNPSPGRAATGPPRLCIAHRQEAPFTSATMWMVPLGVYNTIRSIHLPPEDKAIKKKKIMWDNCRNKSICEGSWEPAQVRKWLSPSCSTSTAFPKLKSSRPWVGMPLGLPAWCIPVHLGRTFRRQFIPEERKIS